MAKIVTVRDAYHKLKPETEGYALAFRGATAYEFVLGDAVRIKEALGDVPYDTTVDYKKISVGEAAILPFVARLVAKGFKVAIVDKQVGKSGKIKYSVTARSDQAGDPSNFRMGYDPTALF